MKKSCLSVCCVYLILLSVFSAAWAGPPAPSKPEAREKCPVCGMFVAKYPDFLAQTVFKDGKVFFFDGVKDMMKFIFRPDRYSPGRKVSDMIAVYVTDYYSMAPIDGRRAFYVIGSDVYGPMGRELIPFQMKNEAGEFLRDHKGKRILTFGEISPELIRKID
ncbi:Nitrous oxide reductase accessory protein NosL [Syntrophus gentianae]|uniref:Nitrous oxide reductase accessory protein NosL n=1 Tax=Syntrophus gentianae TaxID=43775 RepID=A0A1H8AD56_9BACT|nr:nitrous oxide reductase accessory protein NosL [Syntrophus gentianae]SEM68483.1 Nitrous oxide reductase accessory protein NosL [Syntrophus gentianae]